MSVALLIEEGEQRMLEAEPGDFDLDMERLDGLLKMQRQESQIIAMLATKMRISQQSTYDKSKKKQWVAKSLGKTSKEKETFGERNIRWIESRCVILKGRDVSAGRANRL